MRFLRLFPWNATRGIRNCICLLYTSAREYAQDILENRSTSGYRGAYKYLAVEKSGEKLLVFVDCGTQLQSALSFLVASCGIALLSMLVVFLLVSVLSRRAIRPVIESMEKQKQFITDAGHEIKTPLAIISANTDVLELNNGRSEWTDSIRRQTERLSGLVKNLLALSKLEEDRVALTFSEFSLSDAVWDAASPFETLADTQGKHLELNIQPGLSIYGDEDVYKRQMYVWNAVIFSLTMFLLNTGRMQKSMPFPTFRLQFIAARQSVSWGRPARPSLRWCS